MSDRRLIDADELLDRFEKESKAADEHGRNFSSCFMRNGVPCAEWWAVECIVQDFITVSEAVNNVANGRLVYADDVIARIKAHIHLLEKESTDISLIQRDAFYTAISDVLNSRTVNEAEVKSGNADK